MLYDLVTDGPGAALWRAGNLWQKREREALARDGLTPVQFLLLAGLGELRGAAPVTQVTLARHCGADVMMVSQVLRELERMQLLDRAPHPGDLRANRLSLTTRGRRRLAAATQSVTEAQRRFFSALGGDAEAFTGALRLLVGDKPRRRVSAGHRGGEG